MSFQVVQLGTCFAGGFALVLDVAVDVGGETGFTEGAVAGVPSGRRGWLLRGGRDVEEYEVSSLPMRWTTGPVVSAASVAYLAT